MKNEIIELAVKFLMRVDLKGSEVMAFNAVMEALETLSIENEKTS